MTTHEAIAVFSSYSPAEKQEFLAGFIFELTVIARDSYEAGQAGLNNPQRVRRINEAQHRLSSFLSALLRDDARRYPDDALIKIVLEQPDDETLAQELSEAFARLTTWHAPAARDMDDAAELFAKG